jgi:heptosyltransferase I
VPLAVSIRSAFPSASIAWVVQEGFADAVSQHPAINEIVLFPRNRWRGWWKPTLVADFWRWGAQLRGRFDLVVDAQGLGRSGLIAWGTRAPRRIGFADARELGWMGLTERYSVTAGHTVDRMLGLLAAAGIRPIADLRLHLKPEHREWWDAERLRLGIGDRYAVFAPTSRWVTKDWPAERWRELAPTLRGRGFEQVVYIGAAKEANQVQAALPSDRVRCGAIDLCGATSVGQGMAVIAASSLVIANDSAPLHMAVGFDRPLLALFGPTDPAVVGPYHRDGSVIRSPAAATFQGSYRDRGLGDRLMREIAVADVLEALDAGRAACTTAPIRSSS